MRHVTGNLGILAAAFLVTIFVCFNAETERVVEVACEVPVSYVNVPDSLVLVGSPPEKLEVRAVFNRKFWQTEPDYLSAEVDLSHMRRGTQRVSATAEAVRVPPNRKARVLEVLAPDPILLTFEPKMSKRVPVVPLAEGAPAEGYALFGVPTAEPARAVLTGPEGTIAGIDAVRTVPVSLSGATEDVRRFQPIDLRGHALVAGEPSEVEVLFDIERVEERSLRRRPIRITERDRVDAEPEAIDLVVRGPAAAIGMIQEIRVRLLLDASSLPYGEHRFVGEVSPGNRIHLFQPTVDMPGRGGAGEGAAPPELMGQIQNLPESVVLVDFSPKHFTMRRRGR